MSLTLTIIIFAYLAAPSSQDKIVGGYSEANANKENKDKLLKILRVSTGLDNEKILNYPNRDLKLVSYRTQIVAGVNHLAFFKTPKDYECIVIYETLDQTYELTAHNKKRNLKDLGQYCE